MTNGGDATTGGPAITGATDGLFSLHETARRTTKDLLYIQLCLGINGNAKVNMNVRISKKYLKIVFFFWYQLFSASNVLGIIYISVETLT